MRMQVGHACAGVAVDAAAGMQVLAVGSAGLQETAQAARLLDSVLHA